MDCLSNSFKVPRVYRFVSIRLALSVADVEASPGVFLPLGEQELLQESTNQFIFGASAISLWDFSSIFSGYFL